MFAATVYAEAGGQNQKSKKAVAHVMNNRVGTRKSWKNITDVIRAKGQFDGYNSSMYQEAMAYYNSGICSNKINKTSMDECLSVVIPIYNGLEAILLEVHYIFIVSLMPKIGNIITIILKLVFLVQKVFGFINEGVW